MSKNGYDTGKMPIAKYLHGGKKSTVAKSMMGGKKSAWFVGRTCLVFNLIRVCYKWVYIDNVMLSN